MRSLSIRDLENLSGIKAHTLRIWEQRYSLLKPRRSDTNIRCYCNSELKSILEVSLLNRSGLRISQVEKMNADQRKEKIKALTDPILVNERICNELIISTVELDMDAYERIVEGYIKENGILATVTDLLIPFIDKTGLLLQKSHLHPVQEHLVSNLVRQKLIAGLQLLPCSKTVNKKMVFFLPEGEHHELGLLLIYFLLSSKGADTIYIGASTPIKDLEHIIELKKPDLVYTHLRQPASSPGLERLLSQLNRRFPYMSFIISGSFTEKYKKKVPENVRFFRSIPEVLESISA